ncbi:MAG: sigma-70 family RNA polymerase sigma factor [Pseudomonadota bacterium]
MRHTLPVVLPRLRRFARTLTRGVQDADDLVQSALERALQRAAQWRAPAPGATQEQIEVALRSWMFGIMKNAWIDNRRALQRERALFASEEAGTDAADGTHTAVQDRLSIDAAMQRLPDEQQLAVSLVLVEGLSYREAAAILEIPVGTLTSRLSRGREALAVALGQAQESK